MRLDGNEKSLNPGAGRGEGYRVAADSVDVHIRKTMVRDLAARGNDAMPALIRLLAGDCEISAQEAIRGLFALIPWAALPERRVDDSPLPAGPHSLIPEWIFRSSAKIEGRDGFVEICIDAVEQLDDDRAGRFHSRMFNFLGAIRQYEQRLKKRGLDRQLQQFTGMAGQLKKKQFPSQVCFSPTLRCQLNCPYCISAGTGVEKARQDPSKDVVEKFLDWVAGQGITLLGLSGGEPTLYGELPAILDYSAGLGLDLYLASNGLFPAGIAEALVKRHPVSVTLHLTVETINQPALLKRYKENARRLVENKINTALRCNLFTLGDNPARYAEIAQELGISEVRTAVPMPNAQRGNTFIRPETLEYYSGLLVILTRECVERGLIPQLVKPFPLCLLPEKTASILLHSGSYNINCPIHFNNYRNNIVVNPDFSFLPCLGLSFMNRKVIYEYETIEDAAASFPARIEPLLNKPLFEHCSACPLWKGSRCVGACLSYRASQRASGEE